MWFFFALLSAFFNSFSNIARRTHGSLAQPSELSWWSLLISLPLGLGFLIASHGPLYTSNSFIFPSLVTSVLTCFSGILQFRAYKYGDASEITPISNLLPILLILSSFLILGAVPKIGGIIGILFIVAGVYYSSVNGKHKLSHPFKQLIKKEGSRAMLYCVMIWAVATVFQKIALESASPAFLLLLNQITVFTFISVYLLARPQARRFSRGRSVLRKWGWHIAAISVFTTQLRDGRQTTRCIVYDYICRYILE
jgi:drug/metabolite transporter (DMT)-like permease